MPHCRSGTTISCQKPLDNETAVMAKPRQLVAPAVNRSSNSNLAILVLSFRTWQRHAVLSLVAPVRQVSLAVDSPVLLCVSELVCIVDWRDRGGNKAALQKGTRLRTLNLVLCSLAAPTEYATADHTAGTATLRICRVKISGSNLRMVCLPRISDSSMVRFSNSQLSTALAASDSGA